MRFEAPAIVGVLGPNGSGKTTLFELITGLNQPSSGEVRVRGQVIHRVKRSQRAQLARHYHQSYQMRRFHEWTPEILQQPAALGAAAVHLFDEPQLNTQDGYVGFMLNFFRRLRSQGMLVFVCLHPNERWQLDLMRDLVERLVFVRPRRRDRVRDVCRAGRTWQGARVPRRAARLTAAALLDATALDATVTDPTLFISNTS